MHGESHRRGLYQCNACREPFTVTVGTLYERSKVPLHKWHAATHLLMASKKSMSALQVGRTLGLSKKTAWFLCHRIRESLRETNPDLLGGNGNPVEMDESYIGGKKKKARAQARQSWAWPRRQRACGQLGRARRQSAPIPTVNAKNVGENLGRMSKPIGGIVGKRLTYRRPHGAQEQVSEH